MMIFARPGGSMPFRYPRLPLLLCLLAVLAIPHAERAAGHTLPVNVAAGVAPAAGTTTTDIDFVASIGGNVSTVAISGTLAFVGEGAGLAVLDVSDPAAPIRRARLPLPGI